MYDIFLFDLDGTLTDPKLGITSCVQYALESFGISEPDRDKLLPFIGPPLKDSFMEFYGMNAAEADKAVEKYRERFSALGMYENEILVGTEQMLSTLRKMGKKLVVATAKPYVFAVEILRHFNILEFFDEVVGADMNGPLNHKPSIIGEAIKRVGEGNKHKMIMIGDREMDITGAKINGIASVGVRFGYAKEMELENAGADYIADTMQELEDLLVKLG